MIPDEFCPSGFLRFGTNALQAHISSSQPYGLRGPRSGADAVDEAGNGINAGNAHTLFESDRASVLHA